MVQLSSQLLYSGLFLKRKFFTIQLAFQGTNDVQYIDFISISRYFCSYRTISKSMLHLLMLDNYRTAEFSNNILNYQV